ncbi:hypothetical protein [Arundinibacter roseus]|uniref:Uncharacterized protein n=1 Tax=Arundinibacter roseus TaxID=2070510 RepID=A0A4V2X9I8_9BACT|nr:hypothetical protein [Arundinibacter roseus]TDB63965.1 hypothetical protein EZE20_13545 [Arundinibacter roseus]
MKKIWITVLSGLLGGTAAFAQTTPVPTAEIQIKSAVLAAPTDKREGARVYGFATDGQFKILREGTNDWVCLADDPAQKGINVSCYHNLLEPFMARGRELKTEKKSPKEIFDIREAEVKSGKLKMPEQPSTLFVLSGTDENFDPATGDLKDSYLRYVVYIPFATAESTGLPLKPEGPAMPWIMDPGTHRAHIMINPPK